MSYALITVGLAMIALAIWDSMSTMVAAQGGGVVTSKLSQLIWRGITRLWRDPRSGMQAHGGEIIALTIIGLWIVLLWGGWSVVFLSTPGSITDTMSGEPGGVVDTIYFAGFGLFTLGVGDFRPAPGFFQMATALSALSGLFLVSVGISYLLSLANAVADRRGTAAVISGLGESAEEMLVNAWNGRDFAGLEHQLSTMTSGIAHLAERHLAKPVLHYFHSARRDTALEPSVVALHEALLLLRYGVADHVKPRPPLLRSAQMACERLFEVYAAVFVRQSATACRMPSLLALAHAGIPVCPEEDFRRALEDEQEMRTLAASLLAESGWPPEVTDP